MKRCWAHHTALTDGQQPAASRVHSPAGGGLLRRDGRPQLLKPRLERVVHVDHLDNKPQATSNKQVATRKKQSATSSQRYTAHPLHQPTRQLIYDWYTRQQEDFCLSTKYHPAPFSFYRSTCTCWLVTLFDDKYRLSPGLILAWLKSSTGA